MLQRITVLLVLLIVGAADPAEPPPAAEPGALIDQVLILTDADARLNQVPAQLAAQLEARRAEMPPAAYTAITAMVAEAFDPQALHETVRRSFEQAFDRDTLERAAAWLQSPLTRRMTALEREAMRPEAATAMETWFAQAGQDAVPESRVALLQRLIHATHATDTSLRVVKTMMAGLANAVNVSMDQAPPSAEELGEAARELEGSRAQIEDRILARFLYTYREVSDEELTTYVAFWESDVGQWFNRVSSEAYAQAIERGAGQVTRGLAPAPASPTGASRRP